MITIHNEAHLEELVSEVPGIIHQLVDSPLSFATAVQAPDDLDCALNLQAHRRAHTGGVAASMRVQLDEVYELLGSGQVAASRAEALGERAHEDVNVLGIAAPVVDHTATVRSDGANAVRLVQVQVGLVLLLDGNDLGQADNGALHAVHALHNDQNLLPGATRDRVAVDDALLELGLQVDRVVVLEHLDSGAGETRAEHERGMIQCVAHDQAIFAYQSGYVESIGGEAHAECDGGLDAQKLGHRLLELQMTLHGAELVPRATRGHTVVADALHSRTRARSVVLGEAQIVIRAHVERTGLLARVVERPVVVVCFAVEEIDLGARHRAYGPVEVVANAVVDVARVERLVALIQGHKVGRVVLMGAGALLDAVPAQKVTQPAEYVKDGIADVGVDRLRERCLLEGLVLVVVT
jgi:hypothetical protein